MYTKYINTGLFRLLLALLFCWNTGSAQNVALDFDGDNDYITLSPINNFPSGSDFTVEMWFTSTATGGNGSCIGDFRRLFALGAAGPNRFEVGECMGTLSVYRSGPGIVQSSINVRDNQWHCISAIRTSGNIDIYYDGSLVPAISSLPASGFVATIFRVGHWAGGGNTSAQDWQGKIDDIRLWNVALSPGSLTACQACVQKCTEPGLIAYWQLDEGAPNGNNTSFTQVQDCTGNGNNGVLSSPSLSPAGFTLTSSSGVSNFTNSTSPLLYPQYDLCSVALSDPLQTIGIISICNGDPVHFDIYDQFGNPAHSGPGTSVQWWYSDPSTTGTQILPGPGALFSGFSFVSPQNHPATTGGISLFSPNAYIDRCYWAVITVTNGASTCTYKTAQFCLRICLPIQNAFLKVSPAPIPPATTFCDGDNISNFNVALISNMPQPNQFNFVHINWSVMEGGNPPVPLTGPGYDDQVIINYGPVTLMQPKICFMATITNCSCPPVTVQKCFQVDPKPHCGAITGSSNPPNLMPDPDGNPDHYLICPGNDAAVEMVDPTMFMNCNPVWQYMYPNTQPGIWYNMGGSNSNQNTGILPHSKPMIPPYMWPAGETNIVYRIKCQPPNPTSGCPPCYTNEIRVCLKTPPPAPVITAVPNPICKGDLSYLSVQNPDPNCSYEWYCNGLLVGFGDFFYAQKKACYWVTCNDGCFVVASNKVCLNVCESVAIISCPDPICPCEGDKITIDGLASYSTCNYPLTYTWTWVDANGVQHTFIGPVLMDIPAPGGTKYTLSISDTVLGCPDMTMITIIPCAP